MHKQVRDQWVAALRSGRYVQGKNRLRQGEEGKKKYCCLGVLCDLIDPNDWRGDVFRWQTTALPLSVAQEINITSNQQAELTRMNDRGESFREIADYIEAQL